MRLGYGYGFLPPNLGAAINAITAAIIQAANELSEIGDALVTLTAPTGWAGTWSIVGGDGTFQVVSTGALTAQIRVLDPAQLDFTATAMPVTIGATGLPNITVNIQIHTFGMNDEGGFLLFDDTTGFALRAY